MESIKEKLKNSKWVALLLKNTVFFVLACLILISFTVLGVFQLEAAFASQSAIHIAKAAFPTNLSGKAGAYVASKTGKSYYFPWCGTVNRIKDENLVWFSNRAQAQWKGYVPASNCHGLK